MSKVKLNIYYRRKEVIFMENIQKYYDNTENALPHKNIQEFITQQPNAGKAID